MMQRELSPKNNLSKLLGFFQPMPLITSVTGIIPVRMSHLKFEGYQLRFYCPVKNEGLYSQTQHYFHFIFTNLFKWQKSRTECQLGKMKENCQDQTLHAFHSSCHSCLILCVSASVLVICYLPHIPYAYVSTCKWKRALQVSSFSPHPFSVTSFSLLHVHPPHYHICGGRCTKELSASFLLRENAACSFVVKARHKVYSQEKFTTVTKEVKDHIFSYSSKDLCM